MLRVLALVKENLQSGNVTTRRDIYYRDVELFQTQRVVDDAIAKICSVWQIDQAALNVVSSAKGLLYGNARVLHEDRTITEFKNGVCKHFEQSLVVMC